MARRGAGGSPCPDRQGINRTAHESTRAPGSAPVVIAKAEREADLACLPGAHPLQGDLDAMQIVTQDGLGEAQCRHSAHEDALSAGKCMPPPSASTRNGLRSTPAAVGGMHATTEFQGAVTAPRTPMTEFQGAVTAPRTPMTEFQGAVTAPRTPTTEFQGAVAALRTPMTEFQGAVAAPRTPTTEFQGAVTAPRTPMTECRQPVLGDRLAVIAGRQAVIGGMQPALGDKPAVLCGVQPCNGDPQRILRCRQPGPLGWRSAEEQERGDMHRRPPTVAPRRSVVGFLATISSREEAPKK